ncbi:MAG: hypothetical protein KGI67_10705 [Pseudomonadota bacterium]|nr:hypothetical protein [Pseudomonadota bacterium]
MKSLLLALDIGNSRIKWGLFCGLACQATGYFPTRDFADPDTPDYEFELSDPATLPGADITPEVAQYPLPSPLRPQWLTAVGAVALSSVAGSTVEARLLAHLHGLGLAAQPVWRVRSTTAALGVSKG